MRPYRERYLEHYGVKGMRWGHRKDGAPQGTVGWRWSKANRQARRDAKAKGVGGGGAGGQNALKKSIFKKLSPEEKKQYQKSQEKFANKFEKDGAESSDSKKASKLDTKKILLSATGAAAVGFVLYGGSKFLATPKPGETLSAARFNYHTSVTKLKTWGRVPPYITPESEKQESFVLKAGHEFFRLSRSSEDSFSGATYATASKADFNRYLTNFRHELGGKGTKLYKVGFKSTSEVSVPGYKERVKAMQRVLDMEFGPNKTDASDARGAYLDMTGGDWASPRAKSFFGVLSSMGFDAIIDDMDAGVIGERPLVIFNKEKFSPKVSELLSEAAIIDAQSLVTEITNRKS